jgi:hypothetical protein
MRDFRADLTVDLSRRPQLTADMRRIGRALRTPIQAIPIPDGLELDKGFAFREASGERWSLAQGGP